MGAFYILVELHREGSAPQPAQQACSFMHSFIHSLSHPLVKIPLWRRHAQTVKNGASSHKTNCLDISSEMLNLGRALKALHWFKSYGDFAEWVDFAYWWSFIGKGLCLPLN